MTRRIKAGNDIGSCNVEPGQVYKIRRPDGEASYVEIESVDMGPLTKIGYQPVVSVHEVNGNDSWRIWLTWGADCWMMPPAYHLT